MNSTFAPAQLPFAPRPIAAELFSSWLLRVAAANFISLRELLEAFESRFPSISPAKSFDFALPCPFLQAMSAFCRVPVRKLQALDLVQRFPHLQSALLLRFPAGEPFCSRLREQRLGYAFCPLCVAEQHVLHVPWEWSFACIIRCSVHNASLQFGCPICGEWDPLTFTSPGFEPNRTCRSCGDSLLADQTMLPERGREPQIVGLVQDAYRAALLGVAPHPSLLGKVTDRAFRTFVHDLLQLLLPYSVPNSLPQTPHGESTPISRQRLFATIAALITNAAPTSDDRLRRSRALRSRKLWTSLLFMIPALEGENLETASRSWPPALQRRFASALRHRTQKRWPYSPFQGRTYRPRFMYSDTITVHVLDAAKNPPNPQSTF
jgi:hypothetical protein